MSLNLWVCNLAHYLNIRQRHLKPVRYVKDNGQRGIYYQELMDDRSVARQYGMEALRIHSHATKFCSPHKFPVSSPNLLCHMSMSSLVILLSSNTVQATCRQNWVMGNLRPAAPITLPPDSGPQGLQWDSNIKLWLSGRYLSPSAELLLTNRAVKINDEVWTPSWVNNTLFRLTA